MTLSIGQIAKLSCEWEVNARKAGNVHPGRDFADLRYADFLASAAAIAPILERAACQSVGQTVLEAIQATRAVVSSNSNLGIVLLLAPLAAVPQSQSLHAGIKTVLDSLSVEDSRQVFAAIRLARPGGLGKVADEDVALEPALPLRQIMALAAKRDLVARQYANDYQDVFDHGVPALLDGYKRFGSLEEAIIFTQLTILGRYPDSLILRKRGPEEAEQARVMAQKVLLDGWPDAVSGQGAFVAFDTWLTEFGNTRNPGTSADLVTASLFAALRQKESGFV